MISIIAELPTETIGFFKYQATGNDFVIFDNRQRVISLVQPESFQHLCHRRFGVGADGVILLNASKNYDFEMLYFNADGKPGSMCGNGGRAIVKFAHFLGLVNDRARFSAADGEHLARILPNGDVSLKMNEGKNWEKISENEFFIDTGSPHYLVFLEEDQEVENLDVEVLGKQIRYSPRFAEKGVNVNFVNIRDNRLIIRTYERGVEAETFSCGTGATAAALAYFELRQRYGYVGLTTAGGLLNVRADSMKDEIWLTGPAAMVYTGALLAEPFTFPL